MKKLVGIFVCICVTAACVFREKDLYFGTPQRFRGSRFSSEEDAVPEPLRSIYVSGVEFPQTYDWRKDSASGNVEARLVLFRDGERCLEFPAGRSERISPDPDMHRLFRSSLHSLFSDGALVSVKKNGQPLFEYNSPEKVVDMLVRDDGVWTLALTGVSGICLRHDGKIVHKDPAGSLFYVDGALYEDQGSVCFGYKVSMAGEFGPRESYCLVRGADARAVLPPDGMTELFDLRSCAGQDVLLGAMPSYARPLVLCQAGRLSALSLPPNNGLYKPRLIPDLEGDFCVYAELEDFSGYRLPASWGKDLSLSTYGLGKEVLGLAGSCCVFRDHIGGLTGIFRQGSLYLFRPELTLLSGSCIAFDGGTFILALSSMDGYPPLCMAGDVSRELALNGYLTAVEVVYE